MTDTDPGRGSDSATAEASDEGIAQRPRLVSRLRLLPLGVLCGLVGDRRCVSAWSTTAR